MNNFKKFQKITIRWIVLSTFRTTDPTEVYKKQLTLFRLPTHSWTKQRILLLYSFFIITVENDHMMN